MSGVPMLQEAENADPIGIDDGESFSIGERAETGVLLHLRRCRESAVQDDHEGDGLVLAVSSWNVHAISPLVAVGPGVHPNVV